MHIRVFYTRTYQENFFNKFCHSYENTCPSLFIGINQLTLGGMPMDTATKDDIGTEDLSKAAMIADLKLFENLCFYFGWRKAAMYIALACESIRDAPKDGYH
jgi:hypothetical protein